MSKKVIVASAAVRYADLQRKRDALSTALVALEDASRVKYNSMEYMVGYYNATIRQLLADLPVSHTIKFTETLNRHTATFFGEEK